jgi:hypothetical protein
MEKGKKEKGEELTRRELRVGMQEGREEAEAEDEAYVGGRRRSREREGDSEGAEVTVKEGEYRGRVGRG